MVIEEKTFELIYSHYGLTKPQVLFAKHFLHKISKNYSQYQYVDPMHDIKAVKDGFNIEVTNNDVSFALEKLDELLFIETHIDGNKYKIDTRGVEVIQKFNDLLTYLVTQINYDIEQEEQEDKEKEIQDQINNLTIKQLKVSIFQVKWWWLFLIINAVLTIVVSIFVAFIINKYGLSS